MWYFSKRNKVFNQTHNLWQDGVAVTDEEYNQIIADLENGYSLSNLANGKPVTIPPSTPVEKMGLFDLLLLRTGELNLDYENIIQDLKSTYPLSEAITWTVQLQEAKAIDEWLEANPGSSIEDIPRDVCPFLYDLSNARDGVGVPGGLGHLKQRVLENDALFAPAMAHLTAQRHALERQLYDMFNNSDRTGLETMTWNFTLPGETIE
jgi:hypothetical protein